jgi:TldD protein
VTEDEIRRITRMATDVAKASAIAKRMDVRLAPVPAYVEYWSTPMKKDPRQVSQEDKQAFVQKIVDIVTKTKEVTNVNVSVSLEHEWKYFASTEGSYIEQEIFTTSPSFNVTARKDGQTRSRTFTAVPMTGGWEVAEASEMVENAERIAAEAVEYCTAKPVDMGVKDLILTPSHAMLTIHEIVGHATELDRILGYEANYAGTSFIKLSDVGKLKYGSKLFNVTADRNIAGGIGTVGYDDDGVKTQQWPLVRDGILVGLQTNRECAHVIGEKESRGVRTLTPGATTPSCGCRTSTSMPALWDRRRQTRSSPIPEMGAHRRPQLFDRPAALQRTVRRQCVLGSENGKKTRMVTNVTYNAITTDFWGNLDAVSGKESWRMFGTGGDARGSQHRPTASRTGRPGCGSEKFWSGPRTRDQAQ